MLKRKTIKVKSNRKNVESRTEDTAVIKKHHIDVSIIIAVLGFIIAALSFLFATFPQVNPFNSNIVEKANAGDMKSQLILAEHYYEIADTDESIYWYKIASAQESTYQAAALNNLAYIYANSTPLTEWDNFTLIKAYKIFLKAGELGEITAYRNAYILINSIPSEILNEYEYDFDNERKMLKNYLILKGEFSEELEKIDNNLEFFLRTDNIWDYDDKDTYKIFPARQTILRSKTSEDDIGVPVIYTLYDVYRILEEDLPEYTYIHIGEVS